MTVLLFVNGWLGRVGLCTAPLVFLTALHYAKLTRGAGPAAPSGGRRADRVRHRVAAGHPHGARVRQPGDRGRPVRHDQRPGLTWPSWRPARNGSRPSWTSPASTWPDGLSTVVAAGGVGLSGGQRQRVGIARALLVDSPVVLLDEPTVGLDVHAEKLVVQALTRLMDGRTVIMTTHQPELTRLANRTVYLHRGGVVEEISTPPREEAR